MKLGQIYCLEFIHPYLLIPVEFYGILFQIANSGKSTEIRRKMMKHIIEADIIGCIIDTYETELKFQI